MFNQVRITDNAPVEGLDSQDTAKSKDAIRASLEQLAEMMELLLDEETSSGATTTAKTKEEVTQDLLNRFIPFLNSVSDPQQAEKLSASLTPLLKEHANGDKEALGKVLVLLQPVIAKCIAENPEKQKQLFPIVASLVREAGGDTAMTQVIEAYKKSALPEMLKGPNGKAITEEAQRVLGQLFNIKTDDVSAPNKDTPPSNNNVMGAAMYYLQMFQKEISASQANQDQIQITVGKDMIQKAIDAQAAMAKMIQDAEAEDAAAHQHYWWEYLVKGISILLGGGFMAKALGSLPAGLQMVTGFLVLTGVMDKLTQLIAKPISEGLYYQYLKDDYEPRVKTGELTEDEAERLAHIKADAVGQICAILIVAVCLTIITCGVGLAAGGGAVAAEGEAVAENMDVEMENMAADAEDELVDEGEAGGRSAGSRWIPSSSTRWLSLSQFLSTISSSDFFQDCFMTNPEWAEKHQELVIALAVGLQVVTAIASAGCGYAAGSARLATMTDVGVSSSFFTRNAGPLMLAGTVLQAICSGIESGMSGYRAYHLSKAADGYEATGSFLEEMQVALGSNAILQTTTATNNTGASNVTGSITEEMKELSQLAGATWTTSDKILRK